jgi:hypothetical protein
LRPRRCQSPPMSRKSALIARTSSMIVRWPLLRLAYGMRVGG